MYWRLSTFYFFYFASLGALVPYWGLYLRSLGFGVVEIGELVAIIMATKIVAPNIWGWIADHTGRGMKIVRIAGLLSVLSFALVFAVSGYWAMALVMALFSFFWNAALPQFEANTLNHLAADTHRYSSIRLWGSVGFILTVTALGMLFEYTGSAVLPLVLTGLFAAIWGSSLLVPEKKTPHPHRESLSLTEVLRQPVVISVLLVCFLIQASHGPYYTFYSIYLSNHGYSETLIGQLWALGVVAEIGVFMRMRHWLPRFGARHLLLWATALTALRWLLIAAAVDNLWIMLIAQVLHAASFGLYHAVSIHLFHRLFRGRLQGRGQALYSSLSFGAGGALGSFAAGYLWQDFGAEWMYLAAALTALLALAIVWRGIRNVDD